MRAVERIGQGAQDLLDADRLDLRDAARADRRLDVGVRRVADLLPAREALAQAQERDVAVAVVGRLREDREDQLVEPAAVRRGRGAAGEVPHTGTGAGGTRRGAFA